MLIIKKNLAIDEKLIDGLGDTSTTTEAKLSVNITKCGKIICLSLHYNVANSFLDGFDKRIHQFKAKQSEIKLYSLQLQSFHLIFNREK